MVAVVVVFLVVTLAIVVSLAVVVGSALLGVVGFRVVGEGVVVTSVVLKPSNSCYFPLHTSS